MANFDFAFDEIITNEGIYGNNPADLGGETCYGISRKYNPDWKGWSIIDASKVNGWPKGLRANVELHVLVKEYYKATFWDKINGDSFESDKVACSIVDFAVNVGISKASRITQSVVGVVIDGKIGNKTMHAIESLGERIFLDNFTEAKIDYYDLITKNRPKNEKFLKGWINRAEKMRFNN